MSILMNRRRGVAKSDIQILKDMGCLFWFPFTKESGLKDVVNGYELEVLINDSITFDDSVQMYKIKYPSTANQIFAKIVTNINSYDFNGGYTTFNSVRRTSLKHGSGNWAFFSDADGYGPFQGIDDIRATSSVANWNKDKYYTEAIYTLANQNRTIFSDANLIVDETTTFANPTATINCYAYAKWVQNGEIYIQGLALFNNPLIVTELEKARKILVW